MLEPAHLRRRSVRIAALSAAFEARYGQFPVRVAEAPGRVNLIGEHTDYNDGFVLPVAIDRTTLVAAGPSGGGLSHAWSANLDEEAVFDAERPDRGEDGDWSNYVRGSTWATARAAYVIGQVNLAIESDVPLGAGLGSSAALEVAVVSALIELTGTSAPRREIARISHRAENEFVGVPCGIMDQFASALAEKGTAMLIDCRSEETRAVPLGLDQAGLAIVIVDSGVSRELSGSAYRDRREECREACRFLRGPLSRPIMSLRDVTLEDLALVGDQLPRVLLRRARHVVSENSRVLECVAALETGQLDDVGALMAESHRSLREDYEVSCPEIDLLVSLAGASDTVVGARLTGAGFGGCTVNLVRVDGIADFEREVVEEYAMKTGRRPRMLVCEATAGVRVIRP